ncbi:venom metalloproteinase BumaMPs1-like [Haemaphysalis longicornis]
MLLNIKLLALSTGQFFILLVLFIFPVFQGAESIRIVYPSIVEARWEDEYKVISVDKSTTLFLKQTSVLADTVLVTTSEGGNITQNMINGSEYNQHLYQDTGNGAAVLLHNTDDGLKLNGLISRDLRIEPLETLPRSRQGHVPHKISRTERRSIDRIRAKVAERTLPQFGAQYQHRQRFVESVRPEAYLLSDSKHNKGMAETQVVVYCAVFMTAVNLYYDELKWPTVRLILVGVYVSRTERDDGYVKMREGYLDADQTLRGIVTFKTSTRVLGNADMYMLLSGRDAAATVGNHFSHFIQGLSYVAGACTVHNVGLAEDYVDSYAGVDRVAHEFGHLLGCVHDGDGPDPDIRGHQGSLSPLCLPAHGYLMSPIDGGPKHYRFSPCCKTQMRLFFSTTNPTCLQETYPSGYSSLLPGVLPGKVTTTQRICETRHPKYKKRSYVQDARLERMCKIVCQVLDGDLERQIVEKAPDGWICAKGMTCVKGVCSVPKG